MQTILASGTQMPHRAVLRSGFEILAVGDQWGTDQTWFVKIIYNTDTAQNVRATVAFPKEHSDRTRCWTIKEEDYPENYKTLFTSIIDAMETGK